MKTLVEQGGLIDVLVKDPRAGIIKVIEDKVGKDYTMSKFKKI
jgi:hypothetical protein